jgi:hypothetical protein
MVAYSRIGSRVWSSVAGFEPTNEVKNIDFLEYQILQWQKSIPPELRFLDESNHEIEASSRANRRLRVLIYLRTNQIRILVLRPILNSATSIHENIGHANAVVDIAKDTVRVLTHLNQTSDIYRAQQVCFNYFLVSALAVLFLAVSHAPARYSALCRDEFYMSLDLVKGFGAKSYISKRLWRTIKGLKEIGPKLGLVSKSSIDDPHSSAAVAMAGLAGHPVEELEMYERMTGANQGVGPLGNSPLNGFQMSYELTNLFEAAGGYGNVLAGPTSNADGMNGYGGHQLDTGDGGLIGSEDNLNRILRGLF